MMFLIILVLMTPFLLTILVSAIAAHISIPFRVNEDRTLYIPDAYVPGVTRANVSSVFNVSLKFEDRTKIFRGSNDRGDLSLFDGIYLAPDGFLLIPESQTEIPFQLNPMDETSIVVGIGRGSYLLREYNTISVLRNISSNSGFLILNDSDATQFNWSCVPGTIGRIPFREPYSVPSAHRSSSTSVEIQYRLVWLNATTDVRRSTLSTPTIEAYLVSTNSFAIPQEMETEILNVINRSGRIITRRNFVDIIDDCDFESLVDRLPIIMLTFHQSGTSIALHPDDYIQFTPETNKCQLNFFGAQRAYFINPLMIPDTNVHITREEVVLCDSQ